MNSPFKSCKDCAKRHRACWDNCETYKRDKAKHERLKKLANANREVDEYVIKAYMRNRTNEAKRKQRRRKMYNYGNL